MCTRHKLTNQSMVRCSVYALVSTTAARLIGLRAKRGNYQAPRELASPFLDSWLLAFPRPCDVEH